MSTLLGLNIAAATYVPTASFAPQPVPRSPALAFLVSLLLPGLGQFYCRKNSRAAWILGFFLLSLIGTIWLTPLLADENSGLVFLGWGLFLRAAVFLYVFAFLDAYFTAREMSAGTDPFIAESPRIAAILNLLTRGFGYFYLGQRGLGLAVFIGLGLFPQVILRSFTVGHGAAAPLLVEFLLAALGIHAYSIARKREKEILATIQPPPPPFPSGLPVAVPLGLSFLIALAYLGLCFLGLLLPDYSTVNQTSANISDAAAEITYKNPLYGVRLSAPPSWSLSFTDQDTHALVGASRLDHGCFAELHLASWSPILSVDSYRRALSDMLAHPKNNGSRILQTAPSTLAGLSAQDIALTLHQQGIFVAEHQIVARKGMTLYILVMDALPGASCQSDFDFIRQNLALHN